MKLQEIVDTLKLEVKCCADHLAGDVTRGYASDLLSDVLANSQEGDIWITLQVHENIVAVASMKGLAAIILINGRSPDEETVARATAEEIPILVSTMPAFELAGRLHGLGITG